ncbi:Gx transporter family protein [Paenibacillus sp. N1-5-1-14]|uniref:Gx transporter family protein n=1 Tax=Paenibacillus radicibacter TaxID=2972488 RepID=UPI002159B038|nr:Gx transporter family protein [Paenibacillus radicibacter]MCR8645271.1 Gx transporter family protein [Paenibacillus radicibacter]
MPSSNNDSTTALKKVIILAIFAAVAVVLSIVEAMIPVSFSIPGAKLGLANIMVLTCLYFLNGKDTLTLVVLKTILTSFIFGTFSSFLFSFFGAMASFVVMYVLMKLGRNQLSLIGISIAGGLAHNTGQLAAAMIVLKSSAIFYYLPALMLTGIATGIFVGIAVKYLVNSLSKLSLFEAFKPE